jgi:hypothetical protein
VQGLPLGWSTSPLGPSKGRNASGPPRIAMCAAAEAARYAALPIAGLVRERPMPPWRRGRVTWSVRGPSSVV